MIEEQKNFSNFLTANDFTIEVKNRLNKLKQSDNAITLLTLDFDNFNYVNDLFGYEVGDHTLKRVTKHFSSCLCDDDIFCNVHSDHFIFCLNTDDPCFVTQKYLQMSDTIEALRGVLPDHYRLVASAGILITKDSHSPLSALLDKANYARKKSKGDVINTFCIYSEDMRKHVQWQKQLTLLMESALKNREFQMHLQPKVLLKTGEVVGAEALARWESPTLGKIFPDKFIPIMEQNGFIKHLDFFMLEEACRLLKSSKEKGMPILPISINFSRGHIQTANLVEKIFRVVNSYAVPTNLIEIELTESMFSENVDVLILIVSELKQLGFKVSIDDFGSAYSSLNCLKDVPADIVKIDKSFLDSSKNSDKGRIIISKVVEMVKSLRMLSVMEGVEDIEQVDFLQKLSCDLGQGYFYARPMPVCDYVKYINSGNVLEDFQDHLGKENPKVDKSYLHVIPQEFQMDNWELYTLGKNIDMGLMKGYLDGEATVQYVNDKALEYLGYSRQEFREIFNNSIVAFTHPEDAAIVQKNAEILINTGKPLEFKARAIRKDGKVIVLQGRSSCVIDNQGRPVGIYAFQDVTELLAEKSDLTSSLENKVKELEVALDSKREALEKLRISEERYRIALEHSNSILFEWDFETDNVYFSSMYTRLFGENPLTDEVSKSKAIRDKIHPEDLDIFEKWIKFTYKSTKPYSVRFRIQTSTKDYLSMDVHTAAICDCNGEPIKAIGTFVESVI